MGLKTTHRFATVPTNTNQLTEPLDTSETSPTNEAPTTGETTATETTHKTSIHTQSCAKATTKKDFPTAAVSTRLTGQTEVKIGTRRRIAARKSSRNGSHAKRIPIMRY